MTITLTSEQAHQLLVALQELNRLSIGENAICLPAEIDDAMEVLEARLAQPEPDIVQDAIAYGTGITKDGKRIDPASIYKEREWQGLTDEEAEHIYGEYWNDPSMFIEAIEAKLKEKNA
jgi:hypothetical protein